MKPIAHPMPFHAIEDATKLRRVLEAVLLIEADLDLPELLRHVVGGHAP
jgi:hypothetical protein